MQALGFLSEVLEKSMEMIAYDLTVGSEKKKSTDHLGWPI